jgi:hypothetical protein
MRRLLIIAAALVVAACPAAADAKTKKAGPGYLVGAAMESANPRENICLGGYGDCGGADGGRTMTHVKDPLWARALAVGDSSGGSMILVHTVNIGLFASYKTIPGVGAYHMRQAISRRTGVPASNVIIQADHSHSGPDTIGIWGGVPTSYLELLQKAAVEAGTRAWEKRAPARIKVGRADGPGITSSYEDAPNLETDDEFRLLFAEDTRGRRIATLSNYSPHATVLGSKNVGASGDWPEWAAQIAEERYGGIGLGSVGTLGREDFGAKNDGAKGEAEARARLVRMIAEATQKAKTIPSTGVEVRTTFIREPIAQPILLANLLPEGTVGNTVGKTGALDYDISIDRDINAPWLTAATLGTFAGAARIGDVFVGVAPGESFPEIQQYLREEGGVQDVRAHFHFGASNDFLGYMLRPLDHYPQVAKEGAFFLGGCPEEQIYETFGVAYDSACTDHWTLMVSPTIGTHVACTIQDAAGAMGFTVGTKDPACDPITATDGQAGPSEAVGNRAKLRTSARKRLRRR